MKNKITVCVDGKNFLKPMSGISRYLNETLNTLVYETVDVKLICPDTPLQEYSLDKNIDIIIDKRTMPFGVLQWHGQRLGRLTNKIGCDVFWGPAHRIPFGLKKPIITVVTCHDLVCIKHRKTMRLKNYISDRIQLPLSMRRADAIHAISQTTLRDIKFVFPALAPKAFSTLPQSQKQFNSIKTKDLSDKNEWGQYALFVGTFEPRKNLGNLIKAFRLVCDRNAKPDKLVLLGSQGWGGIDIFKMIASENLEKHVEVIMRPNDETLKNFYAKSRFVILPSLYEGLGLPVIEAKNHGKPSIISKGSLKEIADNGSITVDPRDINNIATAMEKLFFDDQIYQKHLENAVFSPANFRWSSNTKNLVTQFRRLMLKHHQP